MLNYFFNFSKHHLWILILGFFFFISFNNISWGQKDALVLGVFCTGDDVGACRCSSLRAYAKTYCKKGVPDGYLKLGLECDGNNIGACTCGSIRENVQQYCNNKAWLEKNGF